MVIVVIYIYIIVWFDFNEGIYWIGTNGASISAVNWGGRWAFEKFWVHWFSNNYKSFSFSAFEVSCRNISRRWEKWHLTKYSIRNLVSLLLTVESSNWSEILTGFFFKFSCLAIPLIGGFNPRNVNNCLLSSSMSSADIFSAV